MKPATPTLTLEVTGQQAEALGSEYRKTFSAEGGTIGRAAGNRWVLTEGYVSSRHAGIVFRDGEFCIEDLGSTNGVFVNDRRVEASAPCPLQSGDRVLIEPYEMVASVNVGTTSSPRSRRNGTTAAAPGDAAPVAAAAAWSDDLGLESQPGADNWLDQLAPPLPGVAPGRGPAPPGPDRDPRKAHVVAPPQAVPPAVVAEVQMPPDYNPLHPPRAKEVAPRHARVERRVRERRNADRRAGVGSAPASADLAALLAGAGLEGLPVTPEVARQFGEILRVVVAGVLDVLRARQEVKGEFRIRPTIIQRRRNNPLKHSTDAQDALHNLLLKKGSGYLGPVEAFEDAFNDLRHHQLAMLAGVRLAFDAMFSQFDPERLQKEFDRHTPRARKGALAALQSKPDYWDLYKDWVQRLSNDAEGTFRTLFGVEFAKAYEDQLDRLKDEAPAPADEHGRHRGVPER